MEMTACDTTTASPAVRVFEDGQALASYVADRIVGLMTTAEKEGRPFVLGLAAGSSPKGIYGALAERRLDEGVSYANCVVFCLDEFYPMRPTSNRSFYQEMEVVLNSWDVPDENRHRLLGDTPSCDVPDHCSEYDAQIRNRGGIDFQILGIGRNGHIGFNEPGAAKESRTRLVQLHDQTRRDAANAFGDLQAVPTQALTMGIGTILEAREIVLVAQGKQKAAIVGRAVEGALSPGVPASFLKSHPRAQFLLDVDAAGSLNTMIYNR